jgi:hypothetical protein
MTSSDFQCRYIMDPYFTAFVEGRRPILIYFPVYRLHCLSVWIEQRYLSVMDDLKETLRQRGKLLLTLNKLNVSVCVAVGGRGRHKAMRCSLQTAACQRYNVH